MKNFFSLEKSIKIVNQYDEKLFEFLVGPWIGGATENWFAYVLALLFLVFRPQGLFGEKIIERV